MTRRNVALAAAAIGVGALALIPIGRWEARRHARDENAGIAQVLREIGSIERQRASGYRRLVIFDCLTYRRGENPFALEFCVDREGRVIEAFDRRGDEPEIWSLREDPRRATNRVPRAVVEAELERMDAPPAPEY